MISVQDIRVSFGNNMVIDGITFQVQRGDILVLLGKNGSGKSVILKSITGLMKEFSGRIVLDGVDIGRPAAVSDSPISLGYVFQKGGLFDSMTVYDNVAFPLRRKQLDEASVRDTVLSVLDRVGLLGNESKYPSELSGGMQKRVGLARAVCINPGILLYDDPTAGLDPILSDSIADLILDIRDRYKTTSIVATHDLKVTRKIADSVALLYGGKAVFMGPSHLFFEETSLHARQFINGEIEGPIDIY